MAYDPANLTLIGGVPTTAIYHYVSSADNEATIATAGYMTSNKGTFPTGIGPGLSVNDVVIATGTNGTSWYVVSAVSATTGAASLTSFT